MDEQTTTQIRPVRKRRPRKTKMEIIKEAYLPYIFLMAAALLIVIFIIGALVRGSAEPEEPIEEEEDNAPVISAFFDPAEI